MSDLIALDERVGTDISNASSFEDVMEKAGFDFNVEKVSCHTPEGNAVKNQYIIRRDDNKRILGVCKGRYQVVQTRDMFRPLHDMINKYGAKYETGGLIEGGKKCWISAKMPNDWGLKNRPDDKVEQRIITLVSHDATKRNAYFTIAKRVFCNNMLNVLSAEAKKSNFGVSHSSSWEDQLLNATGGFDASIASYNHFNAIADRLNSRKFSVKEMKQFAEVILPDMPPKLDEFGREVKKRETSRLQNRRDLVVDLFSTGAGNLGRTRWDALNAVTEFVDHHNSASRLEGKNAARHAEKRFASSVLGGYGDRIKQHALKLLT